MSLSTTTMMAPGTTADFNKILIILHGSIGDVTRALALANVIRRGFPRATLSWAIEPACLSLVQNHPAIDEVIVFDRRRWWTDLWPFLRRIRASRFDLVIDLQRHFKSGFISRWSGAPNRLGFNRYDAKELNWIFNNQFIPMLGDSVTKLDHYLQFARYLGLEPGLPEWNIRLAPEEQATVDRLLAGITGDFAVIFVGSRWQSRRLLPGQIAGCARMLHQRFGLAVVLLGGREDQKLAQEAKALGGNESLNLAGRTSLAEAVGVINRANLAVGPDTGLMHIAAAVGTPVVSLWGATSPTRAAPAGFEHLVVQGHADCAPCYLRRCPIGQICMQSIDIEAIAPKVNIALSRSVAKTLGDASGV